MKKVIAIVVLFVFVHIEFVSAQVGIGTQTPLARLDLVKPGSDTPSLKITGSAYTSYFHFGPNEDTYIRGGKATSNIIMADQGSGKVGIGTATPGFPLSFSDATGDKISLWGSSGMHYGFGIQSYKMIIHTDGPAADIAFGHGSFSDFTETMRIQGNGILRFPPALAKKIILYPGGSGDASLAVFGNELRIASDYSGANITLGYDDRTSGFTERMRLTGSGNLGIGVTDPSFKLDIADRMRIRSGGGFSSAGLYLNNNANNMSPAFIGMHDDNHVGLWGIGFGWGFTMNTDNGALKVNGSEGAPGQTVTSAGGSGGATWNFPVKAYQWGMPSITNFNSVTDVTLVNQTINTPTNSTLVFSAQFGTAIFTCIGCSDGNASATLYVDGNRVLEVFVNVPANTNSVTSMPNFIVNVAAGNHTIELRMKKRSGPDFTLFSNNFPGTPVSYFSVLAFAN